MILVSKNFSLCFSLGNFLVSLPPSKKFFSFSGINVCNCKWHAEAPGNGEVKTQHPIFAFLVTLFGSISEVWKLCILFFLWLEMQGSLSMPSVVSRCLSHRSGPQETRKIWELTPCPEGTTQFAFSSLPWRVFVIIDTAHCQSTARTGDGSQWSSTPAQKRKASLDLCESELL